MGSFKNPFKPKQPNFDYNLHNNDVCKTSCYNTILFNKTLSLQ